MDNIYEKRESKFKSLFISQFLATWCANKYDDACMQGKQDMLYDPPVEDARCIADKVWNKIMEHDLSYRFNR